MTDLDRIEALARALDPLEGDVPPFVLQLSLTRGLWECRCCGYYAKGSTSEGVLSAMAALLRGKVEQRARDASAALEASK